MTVGHADSRLGSETWTHYRDTIGLYRDTIGLHTDIIEYRVI